MPRFTVARHTKLWNYDQTGWTAAITGWLQRAGLQRFCLTCFFARISIPVMPPIRSGETALVSPIDCG